MSRILGTLLLLTIQLLTALAAGQSSASHTVTIIVQPINEVAVEGGDLILTIGEARAGEQPETSFAGTARLLWTTNEEDRKITVATDRLETRFLLQMEALNVTGGTAAGVVQLSSTPHDLVTGISRTSGSAELSYSATATAEDGIGSEVHRITFTITSAN